MQFGRSLRGRATDGAVVQGGLTARAGDRSTRRCKGEAGIEKRLCYDTHGRYPAVRRSPFSSAGLDAASESIEDGAQDTGGQYALHDAPLGSKDVPARPTAWRWTCARLRVCCDMGYEYFYLCV